MRVIHSALACWLVLALAGWCTGQTVSLTVNPDKVVHPIDEKIYGHFLEHIYHSLHGGLWGEVVWNRSFEEGLPQPGGRGRGRGATQPAVEPTPPAGGTLARHWMMVGSPQITIDTDRPLNSSRSIKIIATAAGQGIAQQNYALKSGDALRGSLWMRGDDAAGVVVRLVDGSRVLVEQTLAAPGADWKEFQLALPPSAAADSATLQILARGPGTLWIDQVSLMPDSSKATGGYRPDLLQAVADLKPATIRWPGGSYVGNNGGYRWKGGVGPQQTRVGKVGWDELDPSAFGTDEFIALCRKLGAEPVIVVYLGSRQPGADHAEQIQDAADWVEYCNGASTSKWGAIRAANGHPQGYNVKYWEIDNEIWSMQPADYVRVVKEFMTAMKKVDPKITGIACGSGGYGSRFGDGDFAVIADASDVVDYLSIHHYENSERYSDGIGVAEAYLQKLGEAIDKSKNPKFQIYFSEWNVRRGIDWRSGLYAGGMLNAFERDKHTSMACPALWLRQSSTGETWDNALINFDQSRWFPAPNYVVMKLFRDYYAPQQVELSGDTSGLNVIATKSADNRRVIVKLVNPADKPVSVKINVNGRPAGRAAFKLIAPDNLEAKNSFDVPNAVRAIDTPVQAIVGSIGFSMPRWSVGVIELSN